MKFWQILLLPLSVLYGCLTWFRNLLYDTGILKSAEFDVKLICVGNISAGGTGKTPLVEYLIRLLSPNTGIAVLSRGYGRSTSVFTIANENSSVKEIGDEPRLYKQKYRGITVAVDTNRANGIRNLINFSSKIDCILLDDAFQHRKVKTGLSIVLTDYNNLYLKDFILPSGTLRESKAGISRADIIIVSKSPQNLSAIEKKRLIKDIAPKPYQQMYFSFIKYGELKNAIVNSDNKENKDYFSENYHILLFTGIANNNLIKEYLLSKVDHVDVVSFQDHHSFNEKDIKKLEQHFVSIGAEKKIMVTTEKDFMRLDKANVINLFENTPLFYLPIETAFHEPDKQEFNHQILKYVRTNKINSNTLERYR